MFLKHLKNKTKISFMHHKIIDSIKNILEYINTFLFFDIMLIKLIKNGH
jgi:hypothetical protein